MSKWAQECIRSVHRHTPEPYEVIVVERHAPFNYASQLNAGIRASTAPIVVCMNDDVVVEGDWIPCIERRLVGNYGITGAEPISAMHVDGGGHHEPKDYDGEVLMVEGYLIAIRADVFRRIGYFDENLDVFFQDFDFCVRAWRAGIGVISCPNLPVRHLGGMTRQVVGRALEERCMANRRYLRFKWGVPSGEVFTLEWARSGSTSAAVPGSSRATST